MAKIIEYPLASYKKAKEIADAVDALGGSCTVESCADKLGREATSGGFRVTVASASKFGLIDVRKGSLSTTEDYKLAKFAYSPEEKLEILRRCFLKPGVFNALYQRFAGLELPIAMLDKLMIREFGVQPNDAGRITGYFLDGLKELSLLDANGIVLNTSGASQPTEKNVEAIASESVSTLPESSAPAVTTLQNFTKTRQESYTVRISGPGLENTIEINEEDDLLIVQATLNKIKKALKATASPSGGDDA